MYRLLCVCVKRVHQAATVSTVVTGVSVWTAQSVIRSTVDVAARPAGVVPRAREVRHAISSIS